MDWKRLYSKFIASGYVVRGLGKASFSQVGEDRILDFLFQSLGVKKPVYVDIGANHPVLSNNTYYFYHRGARGICIEPEPGLFKTLQATRPHDTCLNVGIGLDDRDAADFFVFPDPYSGWNTFSREEAEARKEAGQQYQAVLRIPLRNINQILADHLSGPPDLMSVDVEGLDFDILRSLDFDRWAPRTLVVETLRFGATPYAQKQSDLADFVCSNGYIVYADTHVNTIFLRKEA